MPFGLKPEDPNIETYWGARAIIDGYFKTLDFVPDRMQTVGPHADALNDLLDVEIPLKKLKELVNQRWNYLIYTRKQRIVMFETDRVRVECQNNYGDYMYLCAYDKG